MWPRCSKRAMNAGMAARRLVPIALVALFCHGCGSTGAVRPDRSAASAPAGEAGLELLISSAAQAAYDDALAAMNGGDDVEAELQLEQFVLAYPDFPGAYVTLAILYERSDRHDEALDALDHALAIDPDHTAANDELGIVLRKLGRFADAEQAYLKAIASDPGYALAHRNLGILLDLYLHRPAEALQHYQRYQELLGVPDQEVARWIIDLERRVGTNEDAARVAQEEQS
jgi:tetratricopeptide (TPR) repeat protein